MVLGLFSGCLRYCLHCMVLVLACYLDGYTTNSKIPVTMSYILDCFEGHVSESAAIMGS